MQRASVVVVSPVLPHARMDNAGGLYVQALHECLAATYDVAFICPDVPVNRRAVGRTGAPSRAVLVGSGQGRPVARALNAGAHWLSPLVSRVDVTAPPLPFSVGLLLDPRARSLLQDADVVDVQWSELIRLAPLLSRLAPRARLVGTFHDVLSQRYARYALAREPSMPPWAWRLAGRTAARSERAAQRRFDVVVTLSDKDRLLLLERRPDSGTRIEVIDPPLHQGSPPVRRRAPDPTVVFVGSLSRDDNIDAVEWLMAEVWPRVRHRVPSARLMIVGSNAHQRILAAVDDHPGVELTGFVPELAGIYGSAWTALVPLRIGAGIKFKTIEALVAGVPTVTTSVGAEGIGDPSLFAGVADDARTFADAVVATLLRPDEADTRAVSSAEWARATYSRARFDARVSALYGALIGESARRP